jgi:hypothetical protein
METIPIKILGYKKSQRYPIWRTVYSAQKMLEKEHPDLQLEIQEVSKVDEILLYTPVIAFPSLMMSGKLVCVGRFPSRNEVLKWLTAAMDELKSPQLE